MVTGRTDSTRAFAAAMKDALSRGGIPQPSPPIDKTGHATPGKMADNVTDLGGVVIDLEGGDYIISAPIVARLHAICRCL